MIAEAGPKTTLAEAVDACVSVLIRNVVGERELSRAFMSLSVADPILRARGELVNRQRRDVFTEIMMRHSSEIGHPDAVLVHCAEPRAEEDVEAPAGGAEPEVIGRKADEEEAEE